MIVFRNKIVGIFILFVVMAANVFAQSSFWEVENEITKILLKKDLRQAIKEAENSPANDLDSLLRRLSLYRRAAYGEKFALTVKQIIKSADFEKNRYRINEFVSSALKDGLFQDIETLQIYLQNFDFNGDIYYKFTNLCLQNRTGCDVAGFDRWLAQKAEETRRDKTAYGISTDIDWVVVRINWREKFGLGNTEILNQIVEDVRKNPTDLETALLYLRVFRNSQEINWLAENFASKQAYDYYELGETISNNANYSAQNADEKQQILRIAVFFLQKSLSLAFDKEDIRLINARRLRFASIPPRIGNYEKQLRFWTKSELAETLKNMGEPQNAQPIVEELTAMDKSDILPENVSYLAGAVQASSGARVVESKILREQAMRQDSYEYWQERISYYHGRNERERVFDAYRQALAVVPFDLSNEQSREMRLYFIRRFADFAEDEFGYYGNSKNSADFGNEEKQKLQFWIEAENFLRNEFEKTKSNIRYSYKLAEIIESKKFEKLSDEILSRNSELLVNAAKLDLINSMDDLLYSFSKIETVSQAKKDPVFEQIIKAAENKDAKSAWIICEAIISGEENSRYAARVVPILVKNLKIAENRFNLSKSSDDDYSDLKGLKDKYIEILFSAHLSANDWKSAERLLMEKYPAVSSYSLDRLILNAAKNGAFNDAVRYWKIKANADRRNLENLTSLVRYPAVVEGLREFYRQMKIDEPHSPIPDIALQKLK